MSAIARPAEPRTATDRDESSLRLWSAGDFCLVPVWIGARVLYTVGAVRLLSRLAALHGAVLSVVSSGRAQTLAQLDRHLGATVDRRERRRIARRHFQYMRREAFATVWPCIRNFSGGERIAIEGREHLDRALEGGKGAILVSSHFGFARLLKPVLQLNGYAARLVARPPGRIRPLTRLGERVRIGILRLPYPTERDERWSAKVGRDFDAGMNVRPQMAALARNELVIALADGRAGQSLRPVSVAGVDVPLSPTVFRMARTAGAPVLPVFVVDDPSSRDPLGVRLVVEAPLEPTSDGRDGDLQAFARSLEARVLRHPHLWLRWSGPPPSRWGRRRPAAPRPDHAR